jgi:hypothetical protein
MNRKDARFLVILVVASLALRIFRIGSQSLWVDEIITLGKSIPKPGLTIWDYLKYNIQGPLHSLVVYCIHFVSVNDGWLRLPGAVAGAASVYYFYRWTELWLGKPIARLAAVMLAIHPLHIQYSQEVRAYSFLVFFVTFSGYYFQRMLARETRNETVPYVLGIGLAALSNFSAAFIYAVQSIVYIVRRGFSARRLARWLAVSLAILVIISPWVYRIYVVIDVPKLVTPVKPGELSEGERLRGGTTVTADAIPYLMYVFSVGTTLGPSTRELHAKTTVASVLRGHWLPVVWVALVFGCLVVAGFWSLGRGGGARSAQAALYIFVPLLLLLGLCWQNAKAFNVRYLLVSLPAYICVVSAGVLWLPGRLKKLVTVLVFLTLSLSLGNYYFNARYAKEDVRGAARYLETRIQEGECIVAPTVTEVFEHYFNKQNPVYRIGAPPGTSQRVVDENLSLKLGDCRAVWYVRSREWVNDPDGELSLALGRIYKETARFDGLAGVQMVKYER